jgi:hypothetical protein
MSGLLRAAGALLAVFAAGCRSGGDSTEVQGPLAKTVLDLTDLTEDPGAYAWFDFRPDVRKLILSGAAETQHVAILWYTVPDASVGLHFHSKTESVYVIDGTQTDAKGVYPTGTVYFNPPGSGHQIAKSSGFFILAYASPPDFANTALIQQYTPLRIDTTAPDLMGAMAAERQQLGTRTFALPLDTAGGMSSKLIEIASIADSVPYQGNYVLVLGGRCVIEGVPLSEQSLVVAKTVQPESFSIAAPSGGGCLALGVSF